MIAPERPPLERFYDLADLSEAGDEVRIVAGPDDLPVLARWAGVDKVERFEAVVTLSRLSPSRFLYKADLLAELVQNCVVTLEPVKSRLTRSFSRTLHVLPRHARPRPEEEGGGALTLAAGEDEAPEEIESPRYDLAAPLLEELVLGVDPYPRAPGVEFAPPQEPAAAKESPFAALKSLKKEP
ncbi:MAG: DUF177 domain-containing protein [Alphaproteobacteria bacterium]|nr:DUF177 domain-containing protein [Alphaproteobacteria bacterium]MDE2351861.1 DUF177 domain-containing protein [Alphaproteobacteria bacterium]